MKMVEQNSDIAFLVQQNDLKNKLVNQARTKMMASLESYENNMTKRTI